MHLVVHDREVGAAELLQRIGQVGVRLRERRLQQDGAVVSRHALGKVLELVVDRALQQQHVHAVRQRHMHLHACNMRHVELA